MPVEQTGLKVYDLRMKEGGLYWVNAPIDHDGDSGIMFYVNQKSSAGSFLIENGFPVIFIKIVYSSNEVSLFKCMTPFGLGERLAKNDRFYSWFVSDPMLLNDWKERG